MNGKETGLIVFLAGSLFILTLASLATSADVASTATNRTVISINSTPSGAEVWMDGHYSGQLTPSKFLFNRAENHSFELRLDDYDPQILNINTSNSIDINVNLSTGPGLYNTKLSPPSVKININSNPSGAEVWLDNKDTGKSTPFSEDAAIYENHTYELRMEGHQDYPIPVFTEHDIDYTAPLKKN